MERERVEAVVAVVAVVVVMVVLVLVLVLVVLLFAALFFHTCRICSLRLQSTHVSASVSRTILSHHAPRIGPHHALSRFSFLWMCPVLLADM